ncbi:MAG: peptidoglycan-binding protein [Bacillota bacterium]|nr:peptidoglycan-binding protein [Bacillota bacterium]
MKRKIALFISVLMLTAALLPSTALALERYEVLAKGDKDQYVLQLQKALFEKGFLKIKPTGYFGTDTQKAVYNFQKSEAITADGKAGPVTLKLLLGKNYKPLPSTRKVADAEVEAISKGDEGDNVKKLQKRLKALGYYKDEITGFFGPLTFEAVKKFQRVNGLPETGTAAEKTLGLIYTDKAKKSNGKHIQTASVSKMDKFIEKAKKYIGKAYRRGGNGPDAFDCSGFTKYVLKQMGVTAPRTADSQSQNPIWEKVERDQLRKGDLVFFDTRNGNPPVGHVGIYLGKGKFLHAMPDEGVIISELATKYYTERFKWGRRVFK